MAESTNESSNPGGVARLMERTSPAQGCLLDPLQKRTMGRATTVMDLWELLVHRKWVFAAITFLFVAAAGLFTMLETPIFQSKTTVEIQTANEVSPDLKDIPIAGPSDADGFVQTQIYVLESDTLRDRVHSALAKEAGGNGSWSRRPNRLETVLRDLGLNVPALTPVVVKGLPPVKTVVHPVQNTHLLEITCESPDGAFAAQYANALAAEFRDAQMESRWAAAQSASKWFNQQIVDVQEKLRQSEHDLASVTQRTGLMFNSDQDSADQVKLKQLQEELSRAIGDRVLKQSEFETAQSSPSDAVPQVVDDGRLGADRAKLADLRRQLAEMRSQMTPEHYKVKQMTAQIEEVESTLNQERQNILLRMKNDYNAAVRRESLLRSAYDNQKTIVSTQSQGGISADVLRREVDSNRKLYDELLEKAKGADLAAAVRASTVRVIDPASPSSIPVKPDLFKNLLMSLIAGSLLTAAFIVGADHINRRFRAPGETTFHLDLPELGVIPDHVSLRISQNKNRKTNLLLDIGQDDASARQSLAGWQDNPTLVTESYRSTVTSILLGELKGTLSPVILVTSCDRGEGKSTTISNLACALAEIKRKVVLIDADMRKPQLHQIFGIPNTWGLGDILAERNSLADASLECLARPTPIDGLHLLPAGPGVSNSWTLLNSRRMADLVAKLRTNFDAVLIDTAPMSYIPDARVLGRLADGVVLVVRAGETTRDQAMAAKARLLADGISVLGTVLNRWDPKSRARYGYYGYAGNTAEERAILHFA